MLSFNNNLHIKEFSIERLSVSLYEIKSKISAVFETVGQEKRFLSFYFEGKITIEGKAMKSLNCLYLV